jgi:hypothetical protein
MQEVILAKESFIDYGPHSISGSFLSDNLLSMAAKPSLLNLKYESPADLELQRIINQSVAVRILRK